MSWLQDLFSTIVNMSITASFVAAGVILLRLLLKKAPRVFSYILWAPVLFRLVCPFSFSSTFSFLNLLNMNIRHESGAYEFVPGIIGMMDTPIDQTGIGSIDNMVNASLPAATPAASADPVQILIYVASLIWVAGLITLLIYSIISYVKIKVRLQTATLLMDGNVFETDAIGTAFVCGFIRPKIYVPANIGEADLSYILEHERTHIRRKDYIIKAVAFLALILHWFNPLMWLCFSLMSRDMEMSCDESVLRRLGDSSKGAYSKSLLALSVRRKGILTVNPLAFGENHVKTRIKNILNFKKPAFWGIVTAVIAVCAAAVAFTANPYDEGTKREQQSGLNESFSSERDFAAMEEDVTSDSADSKKQGDTERDAMPKVADSSDPEEIARLVEENLAVIMSSPKGATDPQDYIREHKEAYENIMKLGGEEVLQYMLSQFESGNADGLRGHIMMLMCREILGVRDNVVGDNLTPQEWYSKLSIRKETKLPDFEYNGSDPVEKLVYDVEVRMNSLPEQGFTIVASKIFGSYEENGLLKVFVTTYSATYKLYDNVLKVTAGSVIPAAITYKKDDSGSYELVKYEQAEDGAYWKPSIKKFCTMPASGKKIRGLDDKIIEHYSNREDLHELHWQNLFMHLKSHGIEDATLYDPYGEVEFSMRKAKYSN